MRETDRRHAELLWRHHLMGHGTRPADIAVALGSTNLGVAAHAAGLYHRGLFPVLVLSGGNSPSTLARFPRGEAVHYREHVLSLGVPDEAVLVEPDSANTGENIAFTRDLVARSGLDPQTVLVVCKPYMERRAYATVRKLWPSVEPVCSSAPLSLDEYIADIGDAKLVVDMVVGDMQRVIEYPARGFSIPQPVPEDVLAAFDALVRAGYNGRLIAP
ncbi:MULTISPECIES: YdcF family protein [Nocardiopsidaceae]|uniref:YdcF family protein n=1 Tax=Streptomonospora nanhaiensis TaxID=1323731 RepID=A0ABY6YPF5_9ACTN|nr:YdcF family protein [Streptomonospora nanhaiensis]WAE74077.1 YdcF family protein [Streptomonospora nanhaiensis]